MSGDGVTSPSARPVAWFATPLTVLLAVASLWVAGVQLVAMSGVRPADALEGGTASRLLGETSLVAALAFLWLSTVYLASRLLPRLPLRLLNVLAGTVALLHVFATLADILIYRHLGHRLGLYMLASYRLQQNPRLLGHFLSGDPVATALGAALLAAVATCAVKVARRGVSPPSDLALAGLLAVTVGAGLASAALTPPGEAGKLAPPTPVVLFNEGRRQLQGRGNPRDFARGVREIHSLLGRSEAEHPLADYPLWRPVPDDRGAYQRFAARPLAERPDVVLLILESARGWELDFRNPTTQARAPELVRLFEERGHAFVNTHSNGFPSVEGWASINLGVWCHPERLILGSRMDRRFLSLPAVLGMAGYHRTLVATERWEPIQPWYRAWYDVLDLDPALAWDAALVDRFIELYDAAPRDRPRLFTLITISSHPPYSLPPGETFPPGPRAAYLRAIAHMDQSLGRLFAHLRRSPRWRETIVVAVGDHSTTNSYIALRTPRFGTPNAGETWTTLLFGLPGSQGGVVDERVASHVDVAPTVLGLLGIEVSNAFMGRHLLGPAVPDVPAIGFHFGGVSVTDGSDRLHFRLEDPGFLTKFRWDVLLDPASAPVEQGNYLHGTPLAPTEADRRTVERVRRAAEAYEFILDEDRIVPPGTPGVPPS